ncbi:MAG TPA: methanogenesis marker 6 protein [Methanothermococcus okinawensis]|uniref:Methanogenesis marker 6 protein n=1 Tax=Methanothermococcus okinawensis TaxID=155863 RepID=A0A832ZZ19_9EURY|nr:methanogenesis marker 6 protein [Methanothermococcus okinawensis]
MKTKVIVLSEDARTSPAKLFRFLNSLDYDIKVKETCFGAYIEGEEEVVDKVANIVRNLERNKIFCKDRGFPIWDKRVCRAFRGGGPRFGFHQLEAEQRILEWVSKGLEELERGDVDEEEIERRYKKILSRYEKLDVEKFREIVEEELSRIL